MKVQPRVDGMDCRKRWMERSWLHAMAYSASVTIQWKTVENAREWGVKKGKEWEKEREREREREAFLRDGSAQIIARAVTLR